MSFQIFCSRCSSHSAPLPRYGQMKPVRVCTHCYMFHVTPFYSDKAGIWPQIIIESTQFMQWTEPWLCTKQMLHCSGNGDLVTVIVPTKQGFRLRPLQMAEAETWNTQPGVMILWRDNCVTENQRVFIVHLTLTNVSHLPVWLQRCKEIGNKLAVTDVKLKQGCSINLDQTTLFLFFYALGII